MGTPYSQDLRDRVLAAYDRGVKTKQIAEVFRVSRSWARRAKQRRNKFGETTPRQVGRPAGGGKIDRDRLAQLVRERPDATAPELRASLGVQCSDSAIYAALKKMNLTFKKRRFMPPSRSAPTSPSDARSGNASSHSAMRAG